MKCDPDRYRQHITHRGYDAAREDEIIHIVHRIIENGFDRALGDDPTQKCIEAKAKKTDRS